jgi:hypothetical protein
LWYWIKSSFVNLDGWKNGWFWFVWSGMTSFADLVISLNLVLAGLRLGLKNRQVGEKWVYDECSYLCKGLYKVQCSKYTGI